MSRLIESLSLLTLALAVSGWTVVTVRPSQAQCVSLACDATVSDNIDDPLDSDCFTFAVVQDGERNRALTIVKSRGTGHSNQVRELTLSNEGVGLTDVFVAQGKVLMGVARWEWEQEQQAGAKRTKVAAVLKRLQLELSQAEAAARLQVTWTAGTRCAKSTASQRASW